MSGVVRIFVYGTLMQSGKSKEAERFHGEASFLEKGTIPGKLYELDGYPGAMYDSANRTDRIHGEIWRMHEPGNTLAWLDEYEEIGEGFMVPQEYVRRIIAVDPENGYHLACYTYLYNWFVDGRSIVPDGRWEN